MLTAHAQITHERSQGTELAAAVHRGERIARAEQQLLGLVADLIAEGARAGELRDDAEPGERASYCLHALTAAGSLARRPRSAVSSLSRWPGLRPPH